MNKVENDKTSFWFMNCSLSNEFIMRIKELNIKNLCGHIENHMAILNRNPTKKENLIIFGK